MNGMNVPDFHGFQLEGRIYTGGTRLTILWFSRIDHELESWRQIQVTLVGARLVMADVKIGENFPPLVACVVAKMPTPRGERIQLAMSFERGQISFECDDMMCSEFSRKVRFLREFGS